MEIIFREGQGSSKDVCIKDKDKSLWIFFMNVGDLYWSINKSTPDSLFETFDISESEKEIYQLFDTLYYDISNGIVFDKRTAEKYKRFNTIRNLFNEETKTIEWHSDETYFDSDDVVKIIKQDHNYHIEFSRPEKYKDPFFQGSYSSIYIRFCTSGGFYSPFHVCFVRMYRNLLTRKESSND